MTDKALRAIERHQMFFRGDGLVVGLSGGADSVALFHFLYSLREEWRLRLRAVHVNHNLRGDESLRDENFVRDLCRKLDIALTVYTIDAALGAEKAGQSIEEYSRKERYRLFQEICGPGDKVCTAHTLSDSAETTILNLTRGTGLRGLCGVPPVRGNIVRPLIDCSREEIEDYCKKRQLPYVTDSTNLSEQYTRNKLRLRVMPILREVNPAFLKATSRTSEVLRSEDAYLRLKTEEALEQIKAEGGSYDSAGFLALHDAIATRALISLCVLAKVGYSHERIALLRDVIRQGKGDVQLAKNVAFRCKEGSFNFTSQSISIPETPDRLEISITELPGIHEFPHAKGNIIKISLLDREEFENNHKDDKKLLKNAVDYGRIGKLAIIRRRLPGDRMYFPERGCSKSLKKLFNEEAVPVNERNRRAILAGEAGEVLWIQGFGSGFRPGPDTKRFVVIEAAVNGQ